LQAADQDALERAVGIEQQQFKQSQFDLFSDPYADGNECTAAN